MNPSCCPVPTTTNAISEVGNIPNSIATGITFRYLKTHVTADRKTVRANPVKMTSAATSGQCIAR